MPSTQSTDQSDSTPSPTARPTSREQNIHPSLQNSSSTSREQSIVEDEELPDPEEEDEEEDNEEQMSDEDVELLFFSRSKRPKQLVCPFSDASRPNPCTTHEQPRKKKKSIQKHLQHVKEKDGDEKHPLNDPL